MAHSFYHEQNCSFFGISLMNGSFEGSLHDNNNYQSIIKGYNDFILHVEYL